MDNQIARLIRPSLDEAFAFGRDHVLAVLDEYFALYAAIATLGIVAIIWFVSMHMNSWYVSDMTWISWFAATATAVRFARPTFRMNATIVLGIVGISVVQAICIAALFGLAVLAILAARVVSFAPTIAFVLVPIAFWISVKLSLASPIYALRFHSLVALASAFVGNQDPTSSTTTVAWSSYKSR